MDADVVSALVAMLSLVVSGAAYRIARDADARAQTAARTEVYLSLRTRFMSLHAALPHDYGDPGWEPRDKAEREAATRYWYHAFDEWYVTTQIDRPVLGSLWTGFFEDAVLSGVRRRGLRLQLVELMTRRADYDALWNTFAREVAAGWARTHPAGSGRCAGLGCRIPHREPSPRPSPAAVADAGVAASHVT